LAKSHSECKEAYAQYANKVGTALQRPPKLASITHRSRTADSDPAYLIRTDNIARSGSGESLGRRFGSLSPGCGNCACEAFAALHSSLDRIAHTNPLDFEILQTDEDYSPETRAWTAAWEELLAESSSKEIGLRKAAERASERALRDRIFPVVQQYEALYAQNEASAGKAAVLSSLKAAKLAHEDIRACLGGLYEVGVWVATFPAFTSSVCASALALVGQTLTKVQEEAVLSYAATLAYAAAGVDQVASSSRPRHTLAAVVKSIWDLANALGPPKPEEAKAKAINLLESFSAAEAPLDLESRPPGGLISTVLGIGPAAEAASSSARQGSESLLVTVSPKSRAVP
jgi:hypothetical protein